MILVSSVLTWGDTPRKIKPPEEKPEGEEGEEGEGTKETEPKNEEDDEEKDEAGSESGSVSKKQEAVEGEPGPDGVVEGQEEATVAEEEVKEEEPVEYLPFKETDYSIRVAKEKYEKLKQLEDAFLNMNIENVKTVVVCAGVFYGKGELAFKNALKV